MQFKKSNFLLGTAVALALGFGACKTESNEIKIGMYHPLSGGSAPMGNSARNGSRLAVEEINAAGGIGGKKLVLVERDDESKNERGGQLVQELIEKEKVVAILGPTNTGVADASTKYSNEKKVPHIINVSAGAKVNDLFATSPDNYIFRIAANDYVQSEMIVKEACDLRKFTKVAVICDDTNYGQNGSAKLQDAMKKRNLVPVYIGKFKVKDTDMTPQLQEAKKAGAQAILTYGIGPELAALCNSMEKIAWKADVVGSWTLSMSNFINNAAKNGNGATMPQTFIQNGATDAKAVKFIADYAAKFNESPIPVGVAAAQGYDSVYLLKLALEQAGAGADGAKIKAALENLTATYTGVTGTYTKPFSATDHEAIKEANVKMGVVKDGVVIPPAAVVDAAAPAPAPAKGVKVPAKAGAGKK
jgi:branched-chain amino acid transport system substrate-binding protein